MILSDGHCVLMSKSRYPIPDGKQCNFTCAHAMIIGANLKVSLTGLLWAEAVNTADEMANVSVNTVDKDKSAYEKYMNKKPKIYKNLVQWGRIGYVTIWKNIN